MKRKKELDAQSKLLIAVAAVLLIGVSYYLFVYKALNEREARANAAISEVEAAVEAERLKVAGINARKEEIEKGKKLGSTVEPDNNSNAEWAMISEMLKRNSTTFALSFSDGIADGDYVRRAVQIGYSAPSYKTSRAVLDDLSDCIYRNMIKNLTISANPEDGGLSGYGPVDGSFSIVFIESAENKPAPVQPEQEP